MTDMSKVTPENVIQKLRLHKPEQTPAVCMIAIQEIERLRAENAQLKESRGIDYENGWMECASRAIEICRNREGVSDYPIAVRREAAKCADSIEFWCVTDCDKWSLSTIEAAIAKAEGA